jgi:hypothetical protein
MHAMQCVVFLVALRSHGYLRLRLSNLLLFTRLHCPEAVTVRPISGGCMPDSFPSFPG